MKVDIGRSRSELQDGGAYRTLIVFATGRSLRRTTGRCAVERSFHSPESISVTFYLKRPPPLHFASIA